MRINESFNNWKTVKRISYVLKMFNSEYYNSVDIYRLLDNALSKWDLFATKIWHFYIEVG